MRSSGGAGLIGGALLADAFEDHEDNNEQEAYDQGMSFLATSHHQTYLSLASSSSGYDQAEVNDDYGDDNNGGDW